MIRLYLFWCFRIAEGKWVCFERLPIKCSNIFCSLINWLFPLCHDDPLRSLRYCAQQSSAMRVSAQCSAQPKQPISLSTQTTFLWNWRFKMEKQYILCGFDPCYHYTETSQCFPLLCLHTNHATRYIWCRIYMIYNVLFSRHAYCSRAKGVTLIPVQKPSTFLLSCT